MNIEPSETIPSPGDGRKEVSLEAPLTPRAATEGVRHEWNTIGSMTVVVPLRQGIAGTDVLESLRAVLAEIDQGVRNDQEPFKDIPSLHIAGWVVLPERVRGHGVKVAPSLVTWTVFDGPPDNHLRELATHARDVLDRIYAPHCDGYPGAAAAPDEIRAFLTGHETRDPVALYVGTPGRSVNTIELEDDLARALADFVRKKKAGTLPNNHLFLEVKRFVDEGMGGKPELAAFARRPPAAPPARRLLSDLLSEVLHALRSPLPIAILLALGTLDLALGSWLGIAHRPGPVLVFVAASVAALAVLLAGTWALALSVWVEPREALRWIAAPMRSFKDHDAYLRCADNEGPGMNRMTIITDVKPGFLRALTLRTVLWLVGFRARRDFSGRLQGVETIHFAQWRLVDDGRRLLFMSNYDGPALSYFEDFSENAAPGVNGIWSNTEGFPPTTLLIGGGARDLEGFQNAARVHQIATGVWYCGYPTRRFSTRRINDNRHIHQLLTEFPVPSAVDEWVQMLEGYRA